MSKGKKRFLTTAGIILLLALTVLICYLIFSRKDNPNLLYDDNATVGVMPGIDVDERRKQLQEVLGTALADGVISGKDKMTIKLDGVDVELPEDEAIAALQGRIQEITEKMSTAQQKSSMEALKIKYGSSQMDHASFQGFQQELIAQGEQAKKGYDDALNAGLTGLALQYPNGGAEYEAAKEELAKNYHENVNNWNNSAQDFQFDMLAENYAVAFETAFADMDLKGANVQEKIKEAMKNATADGVDVSAWDVDTASKYLGLDKLSEESAEAITLITSDIAETVQGKLSEAFAGGTAGTISEDGYHPMSLLAGLPENIAAELQNVDFSSAFEKAGIQEHVKALTPYLEERLDALVEKYDCLSVRRGKGFMQGLVVTGRSVGEVVNQSLENGLMVISAGSDVLRLVPPLVIEKEHIDEMIEKLEKSLA